MSDTSFIKGLRDRIAELEEENKKLKEDNNKLIDSEVESIVADWECLLRVMKSWEIRKYSYNWIDIYGNITYRPTWTSFFIEQF